jgi:hypothetical protein
MSPIRIQLSRRTGFELPAGTVSVARPTRWGNPFVVGRHGTATECVALYALLMLGMVQAADPPGYPSLEEQQRIRAFVMLTGAKLTGRNLACWCRPDKPCHADVLLELFNAKTPSLDRFHGHFRKPRIFLNLEDIARVTGKRFADRWSAEKMAEEFNDRHT